MLFFALGLLFAAPRVRVCYHRPFRGAAALVILLALGYTACTQSHSGTDMSGQPGPSDMSGLAPGSYPFHVKATSGATTATLPLTLVIK
jgi:hypothetical protein